MDILEARMVAKLERQRDQLAEALRACEHAFRTTNVSNGAVREAREKTRAALKQLED